MRSRAAILPYPGDPFLIRYWLDLFDRVWGSEIDTLYIYLNSTIEPEVVKYIKSVCLAKHSAKINFTYNDVQIEHGEAIKRTLAKVTEDYVMLVEDDGFIFKPGTVNAIFKKLESGDCDIIGSKRGSCGTEILRAAKAKWHLNYEGLGDQGPNFWPNFFFIKTDLLRQIPYYGATSWVVGQLVEPLDYVIKDIINAGDTFVEASLRLRTIVPENRIVYIPQYHGSPNDIDDYQKRQGLWDSKAPWCHIGSLSSGVGGILMDDSNRSLTRRLIDPDGGPTLINKSWCQTENERFEFERRVQQWLTFVETAPDDAIPEFKELYKKAVYRIIDQYKLKIKRIRQRQRIYKEIGL